MSPAPVLAVSAVAVHDGCLLLVDTINTLESGVPNAIRVFEELRRGVHEATDVKAKLEENPQTMQFYEEIFRGRFYCPPGADPSIEQSWVPAETPEGFAIAQKLQDRCPPRKLRYCPPQKE